MPISPSTFTDLDWLLVLVLGISTVAAFLRGLIKVLFSLAGLVLGTVAAAWYSEPLAGKLAAVLPSLAVAQVAAFLLIVAAVMVISTLLANLLRRSAHAIGLGFFDRLLGAAFGFLRGFLLGSVALLAAAAFAPDSAWISSSALTPYFLAGAHAVSSIVPQKLQQQVATGARQLLLETPELTHPGTLRHPDHPTPRRGNKRGDPK